MASKQEGVGDQRLRPDVHVKRRHPWLHNRSEPGKLGYPLLWGNTFQATAKSGMCTCRIGGSRFHQVSIDLLPKLY